MPTDETDLRSKLEGLVEDSEVWEIGRRYRIRHDRDSDAPRQAVEVDMMFLIAADGARNISAASPRQPDLNVVMATVRWSDLHGHTVPPQRSSDP